ncbi:MAG: hypothetical protein P0Y66_09855 [Candidatus Kaistia colombiensis]|nr:MAG: hypothetical protein P0Y66_09855 [Kaistia sp.]
MRAHYLVERVDEIDWHPEAATVRVDVLAAALGMIAPQVKLKSRVGLPSIVPVDTQVRQESFRFVWEHCHAQIVCICGQDQEKQLGST